MLNFVKYLLFGHLALMAGMLSMSPSTSQPAKSAEPSDAVEFYAPADDSIQLKFPLPKEKPDGSTPAAKGLQGKDPNGSSTEVTYDPITNEYNLERNVGGYRLGGQAMNLEEYAKYDLKKSTQDYWKSKNAAKSGTNKSSISDLIPALQFNKDDIFDQLQGGGLFDLKLNASVELIMGFIRTRRDDPSMDIRNQRTTALDFDSKIELNLNARIGNRFDVKWNYNTEALFAFDNIIKTQFEGKEDDIIKLVQAGNVSFPLNTTLIQGSQNLFGLAAKLQFGNTFVTTVFSEQRSESKTLMVEGGAQSTPFNFKADEYEDDRHFFLSHYFRNNYNNALSKLPVVNSNVNILKVEVWVTNIGSPVTNNRNIVAFTDLAESNPGSPELSNGFPTNEVNGLLRQLDMGQTRNINTAGAYLSGSRGLTIGQDFEKVESARRLQENEYTFNKQLGFISLNTRLNSDQVLAVAYQYQIIGKDSVYQVGEFSDQGITDPQALVVKLLRSSSLNTKGNLWKLMMKNIYNLNAFQVSPEDFRLNIVYAGDAQGVMTGYFENGPKANIPLIELFGLDRMDGQQNLVPDGVFDFIDNAGTSGGIVESANGRVYLPYVEPFGKDLIKIFGGDEEAAEQYMFKELYENTRVEAQQFPMRNKYYFEGSFKSSSSNEISIGSMNVPPGSVRVMAGSTPLVENVDYTVDYMLGRVRIINEGILNSGVPISISSENNSMFNIMTKRMLGLRVDHIFSKNLSLGATVMNLHQSPITQKVNIGEDPISNTIYGFDVSYEDDSRFLTKLVDKILPFQTSSTVSRLNLYGEFAHFIPGHSRAVGKSGTSYIDDFEGSKSTFNLKDHLSWYLAGTPQWQPDLFPESGLPINATDIRRSLGHRYNVAKLSWYIIDYIFYDRPPTGISKNDLSDHYTRDISMKEIFPNKDLDASQTPRQSTLNLSYYPSEKGPYNYEVGGLAGFSKGINSDGSLIDPSSRWAGIMRKIDNTDFEANNVEYIEFWMMDPFIGQPNHPGGKLYFNLGDVSEDLLRDGRKGFENGMPITAEVVDLDSTVWGRVPKIQSLVRAFDNAPNSRQYQDIGYDGLSSRKGEYDDEQSFFTWYLDEVSARFGASDALYKAMADPSSDDFRHFMDADWNASQSAHKILERYKDFTNPEGNSPSSAQSSADFRAQQTTHPNTEDINLDNTLNEAENYFQYELDLKPGQMQIGQNYITNIQRADNVRLVNGTDTSVTWYQFKIPIRNPDKVVGQIQGFQSIRFIRMFLKEWDSPVVLRFATLELVKSEWRKYDNSLFEDNAYITPPTIQTEFNLSTVNIEENSSRAPIPYVTPPNIERQIDYGTQNYIRLNEQALSLQVLNLADGDARAVYKVSDLDLRQFKHLRMMAHAEKVGSEADDLTDGDLVLFVRLGADFQDNYYEYEIPLSLTPWGTSVPARVWPSENDVDIDLQKLVDLKVARNEALRAANSGISYSTPFAQEMEGGRRYLVVGSPSLSAVKSIMIGVRNPKKIRIVDEDDGKSKSAEVWINELRVTDFIEKSGFAATGRAQAMLGDLGNVNVSGTYTSANFGQLETRITELQQNNITSIDVSTNLELGKFLPPTAGVKVPVHYDYSRSLNNPEYNPLDPDIKTNRDIQTYATQEERDAVRNKIQDLVVRQNINFMNVRKEYTGEDKTPHFYDIENFSASYSYSGERARNVDIKYNNRDVHRGGFTYAFNVPNKPVTPFAKTAMAKIKALALISDFNFNYLPKSFSFTTEMLREFNENELQNKSLSNIIIRPTYFKKFDWIRVYDLKWDFAKSIQFDYNSTANAYIAEPIGKIDTREKRDSVWQNILSMGEMRDFDQRANLVWTVPINKIPLLDWTSLSANYSSNYRWTGATNATRELGNTIENSNTQALIGNFDFIRLYNKVPFLKAINTPRRTTPTRAQRPGQPQPQQPKTPIGETLYRGFFRMLMGIRSANFEYRVTNGILLPGFMESPTLLGTNFNSAMPGLPFAFGSTQDIREKAAFMNLLSRDSLQNNPYMEKFNKTISASMLFEPFTDFRVQFNANMTKAEDNSVFYKYDWEQERFREYSPQFGGSYNITTIAWKTAFAKDNSSKESPIFQTFLDNRQTIADRLAQNNPNSIGTVQDSLSGHYYPFGYGPTSQEVLIPAFIAAYLGRDVEKVSLSAFPKIPIPNWNLTYNGLTKLKFLKDVFNRISLQHAYRSTYSVGSYVRNMGFSYDQNGMPYQLDMGGVNFVGESLYDNIMISEQFSPLLKVSVEMKNNLQVNAEIKKSRNM
ncbi:MAG: cell surface protein SprA, partial [Bacteroidales bacterium]|nr:cell surface protein SprA [Bacteroidales bacterium]